MTALNYVCRTMATLYLTLYSLRVTYVFYSNARRFYSSKREPLGLKGLKNYLP